MASIQLGRVHPGCAAAGPHPGGQRPAFFPSPALALAPLTLTLFFCERQKGRNAAAATTVAAGATTATAAATTAATTATTKQAADNRERMQERERERERERGEPPAQHLMPGQPC